MGVMNYVISPLWLMSVFVGLILYSRIDLQLAAGGLGLGGTSLSAVQIFDSPRMIGLFVLTISLLLLPKFIGLIMALG